MIIKVGSTVLNFLYAFVFILKYFDTKIIIAIFIASLGWIPRGPIPNQLLEPFLTEPIPGINTKISKTNEPIKKTLEYL